MRFVRAGWGYAAAVAAIGISVGLAVPPVGVAMLLCAGAVLLFFRDPRRLPPERGAVAPADGRVQVIRLEDGRIRLGIFMNVTDVHVNRSPVTGRISGMTHRSGGHWPAFSKESDRNERVELAVESEIGDLEVSLIAGTVARRITPYVEVGDRVMRGQRIGHIAFGSRVDVLFPPDVGLSDLRVAAGDRVTAGETVVADLPDAPTSGVEAE